MYEIGKMYYSKMLLGTRIMINIPTKCPITNVSTREASFVFILKKDMCCMSQHENIFRTKHYMFNSSVL